MIELNTLVEAESKKELLEIKNRRFSLMIRQNLVWRPASAKSELLNIVPTDPSSSKASEVYGLLRPSLQKTSFKRTSLAGK